MATRRSSERADPAPRKILGVLSPDQERTLRFFVGLGLLLWEFVLRSGEPRLLVVVVAATLAGTPLTNLADEIRRGLRGEGTDP